MTRGAMVRMGAALLACQLHAASLQERVEKLIESSATARAAFWGIQVVDLASGKITYEWNADRLFIPASNTKLFSSALALDRLGADFRFETKVLSDTAPDAQGRIRGAIRLAGGGDPNLSGRLLPYRMGQTAGNPLSAIEDLADQVAAAGVKRIGGGIVGDDTWYVWQPYAAGWGIEDPQSDDGPPVSALTVNDNTIALTVRPGLRRGEPAGLLLSPPIEYYRIDNRVLTAPGGTERRIRYDRVPGSPDLRIWGRIPVRDRGMDLLLGIEDPALFAARALRLALEDRGIAVDGPLVSEHLYPHDVPDLEMGPPVPGRKGIVLARRISASLLEDLRVTAKVSQNLHAELALRAVGRARRNVGSFEAGLEEMKSFLGEIGIAPEAYSFQDGSGLARLNLVTPGTVVQLLRHMYQSPNRDEWIGLLPVAGQDGTLSARFGQSPAAGRVFAKTGSLSHVSALSGYVRRDEGEWLAFSILVNNYNTRPAEVRGIMDRICNLLLE
jgi:serine-type D-Ala-D-Ala carboxypeptidase/endopeptidase (penicillin-binding protein 4)